jgi:hypothetical protein
MRHYQSRPPIHINRALRDAGFVALREEDGGELLDPTVSKAFAVADHQIAHVYVPDPELELKVRKYWKALPGIETHLWLNRHSQSQSRPSTLG